MNKEKINWTDITSEELYDILKFLCHQRNEYSSMNRTILPESGQCSSEILTKTLSIKLVIERHNWNKKDE
jgi:hypothetical protein